MLLLVAASRSVRAVARIPHPRAFSGTAATRLSRATHSASRTFADRHIGPNAKESRTMLSALGYASMDDFIDDCIPNSIRIDSDVISDARIPPYSESDLLRLAASLGAQNKVFRSYIGMGYHKAVVPSPILRNVLENPAWYTQYTPYQPEIAQGRLESLLNFQTLVTSMTGMDIANASLLDEATAAAEGMVMSFASSGQKKNTFLVDEGVLPQTLAVLKTRAKGFKIKLQVVDVVDYMQDSASREDVCGALVQFPNINGDLVSYAEATRALHKSGALLVCATDLLALALLQPPGEWGADVVVGNSARFGVPPGYGGPHAAFFACKDHLKRKMPGRLVGIARDIHGNPAYRLALQTREQHIRREKATSNICTSQALLANMAAMYAVYHGPDGVSKIAERVHRYTAAISHALQGYGYQITNQSFFDTLTIDVSPVVNDASAIHGKALESGINFRVIDSSKLSLTLDESVNTDDLVDIVNVFSSIAGQKGINESQLYLNLDFQVPNKLKRSSPFLTQPIFNKHHSETEIMRYIHHLQSKDFSLVHGMIPLGSCTMKLNSASSMIPITWPEFSDIHPFAPQNQVAGYLTAIKELEAYLCQVTGFKACSLQPNSGAAGEYTGLSIIKEYHESRGEAERDICLIPLSAHGTNPASAIMAGLQVVPVKTSSNGSLDLTDLKTKAETYKSRLAAFMITYPSTFGVFEESVQEACGIIHDNGGLVYLDGANLNAQIGLTHPAICGGDVCHLNLHKTFAIPHGGGGPGVGPICVNEKLAPFLPGHPVVKTGGANAISAVAAAPFGSASVALISWAYIKMLGGNGLLASSQTALLNANYIAHRLREHYNIRFTNSKGCVAHELLIDLAEFEKSAGLKVMDFAKRLQDYGFHPPTCSWPISTCMLIEPTESESLEELDRFCQSMIHIRREVQEIIDGKQPKDNNLLKNAPHSLEVLLTTDGSSSSKPYSNLAAAYPLPWLKTHKLWPSISRIDDAYGDLNLVCECPSVQESSSQL